LHPHPQTITPHHSQTLPKKLLGADPSNLARVSWKDIDIIPLIEDAWSFFKSNFLTTLNKHTPFKKFRTKNSF
jgi:hypothetical protein